VLSAAASTLAKDAFLSPSAGEALSPGAIVEVRWAPICRTAEQREIDEAEIVLSLDGGRTFPVRVSPDLNPCTAKYVWKVPALPSGEARLALRAGMDESDRSERVEIVSASFRILVEPDGRVEQLRRRMSEWWVLPEPQPLTAEDLMERRLGNTAAATAASEASPEIGAASQAPGLERPARLSSIASIAGTLPAFTRPYEGARLSGAATPLRL